MKLRLAADLALPLEVVTEKLGFIGRTGSGKTYAAQKLAELLHGAGAQFVALDPVGVWYGLRLAKNGRDPGIPIPVLGGLRGDVPIEPTAGKIIADLVVDKGTSVVIDVSQFESDADKARFATEFASRFFFRKKASPSAVHIFIEEAQEFVPQNPMGEEKRMLHAFHRLIKLGRNFGVGASLITQRPQEVNKKVLNQTELLFAFQLTGPHERKAVEGWIQEKGVDEDIAGELPKLKQGHPHVWSPAWLQISRVVSIDEKWTFDASSTPKVGAGQKVRELAPIDIEQLGAEIKATAERAKADDPKELKKQLAERDRRIRQLEGVKPGERIVSKPVVDQAAIERAVAQVRKEYRGLIAELRKSLETSALMAEKIPERLRADLRDIEAHETKSNAVQSAAPARPHSIAERIPRAAPVARQSPLISSNGDLSPSKHRVLNALAAFETLGLSPVKKVNAAFFAGYTENGHFNNMLGELRTAGLLDYPTGGMVALTDEGRSVASAESHPIDSLEELHQAWFKKLSASEGKLLSVLISEYPAEIEKPELAARCGYTVNGHFNNMLGHLRTLGAIDYPRPNYAAATDVLFPNGLA